MPDAAEIQKQPPSNLKRHFTLIFMLAMALCGAVVFVAFTYAARTSKAERRETSAANLKEMFKALQSYAKDNGGAFPRDLVALHPRYIPDASSFIHPSWPERTGYVFVAGCSEKIEAAGAAETILIYENIPEGKEKLGRQALTADGQVHVWNDSEFHQKLSSQEARCTAQKRAVELVPVDISQILPH